MKTGPPDVNLAIKMEVDEEEDFKQPVAESTEDVEPVDVEPENAPSTVDQPATGSETPGPNVSDIEFIANKKRRIGEMLGEIIVAADALRVCPACWVRHPDLVCPRNVEQTALIRAFMHLQRGGEPSDQSYLEVFAQDHPGEGQASGVQQDVTDIETASDQDQQDAATEDAPCAQIYRC